jgi:ZIP family zinc transporter
MRDRANTRPLRFVWGLSISILGLAVVLQSVGSGLLAAWLQLESSAAQALQAALLAGGATGIGALGVLVSKRPANSQETFKFLALSAGAMFSAALLSLLVPAARMTAVPAALDVVVAGIVGYAAMAALDRLLPHVHAAPRESGAWPSDSVRLMVVAIAVHNLPEGFAVGAGFGGDDALGWGTALSIGMQNVPEGLIVATALWSIGTSRATAFALALGTGLLEPIGAVFGLFAVSASALVLPWALAAAAGAMMFVISEELIPESLKGTSRRTVTAHFAAGSLGMAALLTAL